MPNTTQYAAKVAELKADSAYVLSDRADCSSPDSHTSDGAQFLGNLRDATIGHVDYLRGEGADPDSVDWSDARYSITEEVEPSIYTHARWMQFVDLEAYHQDIEDLGDGVTDMFDLAGLYLLEIAHTLVGSLLEELREAWNEDIADDEAADEIDRAIEDDDWDNDERECGCGGKHAVCPAEIDEDHPTHGTQCSHGRSPAACPYCNR